MKAVADATRWDKPWTWFEFFSVLQRLDELDIIARENEEYRRVLRRKRRTT